MNSRRDTKLDQEITMKTSVMFALLLVVAVNMAAVIAGCSGPGQFSASEVDAAAVKYEEHDYNDGDVEIWDNFSINGRGTTVCVKKHAIPYELETKRVVVLENTHSFVYPSEKNDQRAYVPIMRKYFCENAEKIAEKDYYLPSGKLKE